MFDQRDFIQQEAQQLIESQAETQMLTKSLGNRALNWYWIAIITLALSACKNPFVDGSPSSAATAPTSSSPSSSSANSSTSSVTNNAPVITGVPLTNANVGSSYSFTPSATDANGDTLSFSISNKPAWATFNTLTGTLAGVPTTTGSSSNIQISVSDGTTATSLASFTIAIGASTAGNATVSWVAPTLNTDGSQLTDLAGFTIYYGTNPSSLGNLISVVSASTTSYTVTGLIKGVTYYFAIASVNAAGIASERSSVASKTI